MTDKFNQWMTKFFFKPVTVKDVVKLILLLLILLGLYYWLNSNVDGRAATWFWWVK